MSVVESLVLYRLVSKNASSLMFFFIRVLRPLNIIALILRQAKQVMGGAKAEISHWTQGNHLAWSASRKNSVTRVTVLHHEACMVIPNSYPEWRNFQSAHQNHYRNPVMRKPVYAICEKQRRRSACASAQSGQRLCFRCLVSIPLLAMSKNSRLWLASEAEQPGLSFSW